MAIFGISAHKTTHYHNQSIGLMNGSYLPDPVNTLLLQGTVSGRNSSDVLEEALITGSGNNLKQYYSYATKRFKKRDCLWRCEFKTSKDNDIGLNRESLITLFPFLENEEFRIIHDIDFFSNSGPKTFEDIEFLFGWNDFTNPKPDGTNIVITGLEPASTVLESKGYLGNSWVVGIETSKNLPVIILDPKANTSLISTDYYLLGLMEYKPEPSAGIIYWKSNTGFQQETKTIISTQQITEDEYSNQIIKKEIEVLESDWNDEYINSMKIDTDDITDDRSIENIPLSEPKEKIKRRVTEYKQIGSNFFKEEYEEEGLIEYHSEHYVWLTEKEESHLGVKQYYQHFSSTEKLIALNKDTFKFYPYLPLKEHDKLLIDVEKGQPYLDALKEIEKEEKEIDEENNRKNDREYSKNRDRPERKILNKNRYLRKMKPIESEDIIKSDNRHLIQMGKYLETDYKDIVSTLSINEDFNKIYHSSLIPAVTLGSNYNEVNEYWYKFFSKLYYLFGLESENKFTTEVNNLTDVKDLYSLPRFELSYDIEPNGQFGGFISFAYIKKFKIQGQIRNIHRKRNIREILHSKTHELNTLDLNELKGVLLNPNQEILDTEYYTSTVSGTQYNVTKVDKPNSSIIRTESDKAKLMFKDFGYTYVCKDIGNNELEVIAVAGLIGGQIRTGLNDSNHGSIDLQGEIVACSALHELSMFWERNRKKYIDKTVSNKIDVKTSFTLGSKRKKVTTHIQSFFIVPLDFKVLRRMSGVSLIRLASRAVMTHTYSKIRERRLRSWVFKAVKIIGFTVSIIAGLFSGGTQSITVMGVIKSLAYSAVSQLVIKFGVNLLVKVFGIKGIIALVLGLVISGLMMMSGMFGELQSSLPYASQVAKSQVAANVFKTPTLIDEFKNIVSNVMNNMMTDITASLKDSMKLMEFASKLADGANTAIGTETKKTVDEIKKATEEHDARMQELEELVEMNNERQGNFDAKAVLNSLAIKTRIINPDSYLNFTLMTDNTLSSEEYLSQFIETKLNLNVESFDINNSINFNLELDT